MRLLITGATGFIGQSLTDFLLKEGHELALLTRSLPKAASHPSTNWVVWSPNDETSIVREVDGIDGVINLAGEPVIGKRWTAAQKEKLLTSRVHATQILVRSIQKAARKPEVLVNASAIGYYGSRASDQLTEDASAGSDFLAGLTKAWEAHAIRAEDFGVRVVRLRIGVVLGKGGGALAKMLPPFRMGLGGWLGNGNQWMSWIHLYDLIRLIEFCLAREAISGAVNAVSPQPVTNKAFSMVLAQVLRRPCLFPVPAFVLKLLLGEASQILLSSQRIVSKAALSKGFAFRYPEIRRALESILAHPS